MNSCQITTISWQFAQLSWIGNPSFCTFLRNICGTFVGIKLHKIGPNKIILFQKIGQKVMHERNAHNCPLDLAYFCRRDSRNDDIKAPKKDPQNVGGIFQFR